MPVGKAARSYLRSRQGLHFVPVAPSGSVRWAERGPPLGVTRLQLELPHPQAADVELLDAELLDHGAPDREPADRHGPEGRGANGKGTESTGHPGVSAGGLRPVARAPTALPRAPRQAPSNAGSRFSTNAVTPSWKSRVRARACWSSASRSSCPSRSG